MCRSTDRLESRAPTQELRLGGMYEMAAGGGRARVLGDLETLLETGGSMDVESVLDQG